MAHNSKKFIIAYDGKIKRSRHRTKQDYYRDLKWWEPYEGKYRYVHRGKHGNFCPQCKHVSKHIEAENRTLRAYYDRLWETYKALYGEADKQWQEYHKGQWVYWASIDEYVNVAKKPKVPEPPPYHKWMYQQDQITYWYYDWRSYLCWKCERKQDKKDEMWFGGERGYHGKKANYQWTIREDYRGYRNEVKTIMQRAKYDEEYYDDIPVYKRGWID